MVKKVEFSYYDEAEKKIKPIGYIEWTGEEWVVKKDNAAKTLEYLIKSRKGHKGKILTYKDYHFYEPFVDIPSTSQIATPVEY